MLIELLLIMTYPVFYLERVVGKYTEIICVERVFDCRLLGVFLYVIVWIRFCEDPRL